MTLRFENSEMLIEVRSTSDGDMGDGLVDYEEYVSIFIFLIDRLPAPNSLFLLAKIVSEMDLRTEDSLFPREGEKFQEAAARFAKLEDARFEGRGPDPEQDQNRVEDRN